VSDAQRARLLADDALARVDFRTPPVPLERVAQALGVSSIEYLPLADLGRTDFMPDGSIRIFVNSTSTPHRQRFTLAHEIGHVLIESRKVGSTLRAPLRDESAVERLCDQIASNLMAPEDIVRPYASRSKVNLSMVRLLSSRLEMSMAGVVARLTEVGDQVWTLVRWRRSPTDEWVAVNVQAGQQFGAPARPRLTARGVLELDKPDYRDRWTWVEMEIGGDARSLFGHLNRSGQTALLLIPGGFEQTDANRSGLRGDAGPPCNAGPRFR
jgi:hypothetical protein